MASDAETSLSLLDGIVGNFLGHASATGFRVAFSLDGSFTFDYSSCLKGWLHSARGDYRVSAGLVQLATRQGRSFTEIIEAPFAIRDVGGHTVLVPAGSVGGFDRTVGAGDWHFWSGEVWAGNFDVFTKQPFPKAVVCTSPDVYGHALTRGKRYIAVEEREDQTMLRLFGDHGRLRWFPSACFGAAAERPTT